MNLYKLVRPVLFQLSPESTHTTAQRILEIIQNSFAEDILETWYSLEDERLHVHEFGYKFPAPVGVAAGFDKNAKIPSVLSSLGFGFIEVGGVTTKPQTGNSKPRLFRLQSDRALINRMGFNNDGADVIGNRLAGIDVDVPVGVNLAKTDGVPLEDAAKDYRDAYTEVAESGHFFVINISCPNVPGYRKLQNREHLEAIIGELTDAGAHPLLLKISPDLPLPAIESILEIISITDVDGVIAVNTSAERPSSLQSPNQDKVGGLSGKPIEEGATERVRFIANRTDVPIIGVGGIFTAEDAYQKIRAGACLVQLYTGLIYQGPSIAHKINRGLLELLENDGFDTISDAVGADL